MENLLCSFLESVDRSDYEASSHILDDVLADGQAINFSKLLERVIEREEFLQKYHLKIRDHLFEYLECQSLYFALRLPSYYLLNLVSEQYQRRSAIEKILELVIHLEEQNDPLLDLSSIEIDHLKKSKFIVLIPSVLSKREFELASCSIHYSNSLKKKKIRTRYSLYDLLQTHYGRKICVAMNMGLEYPEVDSSVFSKLEKTLTSFGLNVDAMLVGIDYDHWFQFIEQQSLELGGKELDSAELHLLHQISNARFLLGSDNPHEIQKALQKIASSETKNCNDAISRIVLAGPESLRVEAVQILEGSKDQAQVNVLSPMILQSSGNVKKAIARAVSVLSSLRFSTSVTKPPTKQIEEEVPKLATREVTPIYARVIRTLLESQSIYSRIDAVRALSAFSIPGMERHLNNVMSDEDPRVRLAVLEVAKDLPKEYAHGIISIGLNDDDSTIVAKATSILESRWPDEFW